MIRKSFSILPVLLFMMLFGIKEYSFAQTQISSIKIDPLNRALISFNDFPVKYSSSLSQDKKKISIRIKNCGTAESARTVNSTGIIEGIYVQTFGKDCEISIVLREQRGYTAAPLDFSRAVMVDVFNWNQLTKSDDLYHTALLAAEDNIMTAAKNDLLSSIKDKHANAAAYLGLIMLKDGKINSASKVLELSQLCSTDLYDAYAALAQIWQIRGNRQKAKEYADLYIQKTSNSNIPKIDIPIIIESDSTINEPIGFVLALIDSIKNSSKDSTNVLDTAVNNRFAVLFDNDSTVKKTETPNGFFGNSLFSMIGGVILAVILLIIYLYLKWRNKQLIAKASMDKVASKSTDFKSDLKKARTKTKKPIQKETSYNRNGNLIDRVLDDAVIPDKKTEKPKQTIKKEEIDHSPLSAKSDNTMQNQSDSELESFLNSIISSKSDNTAETEEDIQELSKPKTKPVSAKIEMAMHLAQEQQKIKQKNIETLNETGFDQSRLTEVAKQLGIEKGSLETKSAMEKILNDSQRLSKLQDKFSVLKSKKTNK